MEHARTYYRDRDVVVVSGAIEVGTVRYSLAKIDGLYLTRHGRAIRFWLILSATAFAIALVVVSWEWSVRMRLVMLGVAAAALGLSLGLRNGLGLHNSPAVGKGPNVGKGPEVGHGPVVGHGSVVGNGPRPRSDTRAPQRGRYVLGCYVDGVPVMILATNDRLLLGQVHRAITRAIEDMQAQHAERSPRE